MDDGDHVPYDIVLESRLCYVVKRLNQTLRALVDRELAPLGLTVTQFAALTHLLRNGPMTGAEMARASLISPQSASTLTDRLVQRRLVERRQRQGSARDIEMHLTDGGRQAWRRAARIVTSTEDALTATLDAENLLSTLNSLATAAENRTDPGRI